MSVSNLFQPNNYTLNCNTLAANTQSSATIAATAATNQIVLNSGLHTTTINCPGATNAQILALPDSGVPNSTILLSDNILGFETVNVPLNLTPTTNQLTLGAASHQTVINSASPAAASQTLTVPDTSASAAQFVMTNYGNGTTGTGQIINTQLNLPNGSPILFGANTPNVGKSARIIEYEYNNANIWSVLSAFDSVGINQLILGGGSGAFTSATEIDMYCASTVGTLTGTQILQVTSNGLQVLAGGIRNRAVAVIANTTLDATYCNNVIQLTTQAGGAYTITLPAEASSAGFKYRLSVVARTNANNILIVTNAAANTLNGISVMSAGTLAAQAGKHQITLTQANLSVGDYVDLVCDGTSWNMQAISTNAGAAFVFA